MLSASNRARPGLNWTIAATVGDGSTATPSLAFTDAGGNVHFPTKVVVIAQGNNGATVYLKVAPPATPTVFAILAQGGQLVIEGEASSGVEAEMKTLTVGGSGGVAGYAFLCSDHRYR